MLQNINQFYSIAPMMGKTDSYFCYLMSLINNNITIPIINGIQLKCELIDLIKFTKSQVQGIKVGYVDAYYEFTDRPNLTAACDVIYANCYPYWEACNIDYSLIYMKNMYYQAQSADPSKEVIITETGWPSAGSDLGGAHPSYLNFLKYFFIYKQIKFTFKQ